MVFDHYIRLISCYFSICVYLHILKYRSFFISSDRCWSMFIQLDRYLDVVVLTCFPMYMCRCLVVSLNVLSFCKFRTARHNVVYRFLVSVAYPTHWIKSFIILAWYDLMAKLWSCAAIVRPSVSPFSPVLLSHWLVLFLVNMCFLSSLWVFVMECFFLPLL